MFRDIGNWFFGGSKLDGGAWGLKYSRASMFGLSLGACMSKWEMDSNYSPLAWRRVGFRMYHALPGGAGFVGRENGFYCLYCL